MVVLSLLLSFNAVGGQDSAATIKADVMLNPDQWESLQTIDEEGLVGERVDLWRNTRFWFIGESGYLIDGFENRPGEHPWQGEHLGKWLHAGTIAYKITGDEKMKAKMYELVTRLLASQRQDGYIGTYADGYTKAIGGPPSIGLFLTHYSVFKCESVSYFISELSERPCLFPKPQVYFSSVLLY